MIAVGQVYRSCHPLDDVRFRVVRYTPGHDRAEVVDAVTGKRPRRILVSSLHESGRTAAGKRRRTGYRLEAAPAARCGEQARRTVNVRVIGGVL